MTSSVRVGSAVGGDSSVAPHRDGELDLVAHSAGLPSPSIDEHTLMNSETFLEATVAAGARPVSIAASLDGLGACRYCLLRIKGCCDPSQYVASAADEERGVERDEMCGLCLGVLEHCASLRADLRAKLKATNFEGDTYDLSITLPVVCIFRHHILLSHMRAILRAAGVPGEPDCVDVKMVLRWLLSDEISASTIAAQGSKAIEGNISVSAMCEYQGAATSALECLKPHAAGQHNDKRRKLEALPTVSASMVQKALGGADPAECLSVVGGAGLSDHLRRVPGSIATTFIIGRSSIFIRGRYLKLCRTIPQSPWFIDGERRGETSVEELIVDAVSKCYGSPGCSFHAEGREDIDVRMLGTGRPFVVEVRNPRRLFPTNMEVEEAVNTGAGGSVIVQSLERCRSSAMAALQRDAETHRKTYSCICWAKKSLTVADMKSLGAVRDVEVQQKTPVRVLHRRALASRPRLLYWLEAKLINSHYFRLRLSTQGGMYIKEFVHGDLGRTQPSVKSLLGCQADILQLDVEGLEDDNESGATTVGECTS